MALTHEPLGKPGGPGLWGMKGAQLPAYIQHIRNDLIQSRGMDEGRATATAIEMCRRWAKGGGDVHPDTRAKAVAALAEFDRLRAKAKVTRSETMSNSGYDADGLDGSWDGDLADLPDLAGLDVPDFDAAAGTEAEPEAVARAAKLGSGARFAKLKAALAAKGATNPGALAAWIGRRKYGRSKFGALAAKARKPAVARGLVTRAYPLDDIHIVSRADGDGTGRVVEAYAALFDFPAKIKDSQGRYEEVIDRGAFDATLARLSRARGGLAAGVRVLYNHGKTMEGQPSAEFQRPIGKPLDIHPDGRGLVTRTEYARTPLAEEILDHIKEGRITHQSFEGPDLRSDPPLKGPGYKYQPRDGVWPTVRRMALGLFNYGPALFAAYPAEFLGVVRMSFPSLDLEEDWLGLAEDEGVTAGMVAGDNGGAPEEATLPRSHPHRLLQIRTAEICREAGIAPVKGIWA